MFGFSFRPVSTDEKAINELLERGVVEVINKEELKKLLLSGKKLRIKLGIDPTSPNIHIGRSVALLKLLDFQRLGHQIVLIFGDFTGIIGDASDKDAERPMLSSKKVRENMTDYARQAGKVLDMSTVEVRYNSDWLSKLSFQAIGELADKFSVSDFIARDNIKRRLDQGSRVSLREVLYPLMQGYDSVAVEADVELGGTDQRFNLLAGRTLQPHFNQKSQQIVMTKLIAGLDGRKMSSSWGNTINLLDEPSNMYGKVMSLGDEGMEEYFVCATRVPLHEVKKLFADLKSGTVHPKDVKMRLAREIVTLYHSSKAAEKGEAYFKQAFEKGGAPENTEEVFVKEGSDLGEAVKEKGIVTSMAEWRRLVLGGAVEEVGGAVITEPRTKVLRSVTLKIGKRRFIKVTPQ